MVPSTNNLHVFCCNPDWQLISLHLVLPMCTEWEHISMISAAIPAAWAYIVSGLHRWIFGNTLFCRPLGTPPFLAHWALHFSRSLDIVVGRVAPFPAHVIRRHFAGNTPSTRFLATVVEYRPGCWGAVATQRLRPHTRLLGSDLFPYMVPPFIQTETDRQTGGQTDRQTGVYARTLPRNICVTD